jgi:hypothetical protein
MSLTIFLAICILGMDFMIFVLFKWLYGEKNRNRFRPSAPRTHTAGSQTPVYYVSGRGNSRGVWPMPAGAQSLAGRVTSIKQTPVSRASNGRSNKMIPASIRVSLHTLPGDAPDEDASGAMLWNWR